MNLQIYLAKSKHIIYYHVFLPIRRLYRKVANIIRWLPVIWNDHDWDGFYIYEILKYKLNNQAKYIGESNRHTRSKRDAEIMTLCTRLIEKIQYEYYGSEYLEFYKADYEFIPYEPRPGSYTMVEKSVEDNLDEYFKKYPKIYNKVVNEKGFTDRKRIALEISFLNEKRVKKLLFKILEENIDRWWD